MRRSQSWTWALYSDGAASATGHCVGIFIHTWWPVHVLMTEEKRMVFLAEKQEEQKRKPKWRIALLALLVAASGAYYAAEQGYLPQLGESVDFALLKPATEQKENPKANPNEAAKPAAAPEQQNLALIDPFAIPPEMLQIVKEAEAAGAVAPLAQADKNGATPAPANTTAKAPQQSQELRLTGIVSAGNERRAIIQVGGTAKSYGKNERILNYRVADIGYGQVVLESGSGSRVLSLTPERGKGR